MRDFKKEFPVLSQYTYLNTAYSGLMQTSLVEWRQEQDFDYLFKGSLYREQHHTFIEKVRKGVGDFFNCKPSHVSLIPNFSYAFNTLLSGLGVRKKVLLLENDYPSINEPVERGDFEVVYAKIDENLEENIGEAVSTYQPDIFVFSIVQYINGIKIDFPFLKQLKIEHPNLLIIADGTQFCGTSEFDFENSGIDILLASAYKWLLSGYGNGFMLFKKNSIPEVFANHFTKQTSSGQFSIHQMHLMNHFEPGHLDTKSFGSLLFSIQFLQSIGMKSITSQIKLLSDKAKEKLIELELLEEAVVKRKDHSSIFNIRGDSKLFSKLQSKYILCAQRGSGIRVSFHFYNTEKDLNTFLLNLRK
ncbi:aminotransferase class V-fold PLP-dependent enzyme [Ascidiimonas sp. W6]|uniref:aminotransferase class V-fold PLP-dependent enzyme n=1 Tax=Ascidiimonas meishanensis TaxID=3128903 RepID=UPI0030EB1B09